MNRRRLVVAAGLASSLAAVLACSVGTRYRVLSFFFDGVPAPGTVGAQQEVGNGLLVAPTAAARPPPPRVYSHEPYRENQCRDCHNPNGRWLMRTPEEGLCQQCHPNVPGSRLYVHGPVAANACGSCHHPHESPYPQMLVRDPREICLLCHDRADLTPEPHATASPDQPCLGCHDPHGGADRYFLRQNEP